MRNSFITNILQNSQERYALGFKEFVLSERLRSLAFCITAKMLSGIVGRFFVMAPKA